MAIYTYVRNADPKSKVTAIDIEGLEFKLGTYADLNSKQVEQIYASSGINIILQPGIVPPATPTGENRSTSQVALIYEFQPFTFYFGGQAVVYKSQLFRALANFTSKEVFEEVYWEKLVGSGGGGGGGSEEGAKSVGPAESIEALNAAFPAGPEDGQIGIIRVGTGQDQEDIELMYDKPRTKWVTDEYQIMRNTDQNGPTIGFFKLSQLGRSFSTGLGTGAWWSFVSLPRVNNYMSAGLKLEYRQQAFLLADSIGATVNVCAYIYQLNKNDPNPNIFSQPIEGGWAQTSFLTGGGKNSTADYQMITGDWAELKAAGGGTLSSATKSNIYPVLCGTVNKPEVGEPTGNGAVIDYGLYMRYSG